MEVGVDVIALMDELARRGLRLTKAGLRVWVSAPSAPALRLYWLDPSTGHLGTRPPVPVERTPGGTVAARQRRHLVMTDITEAIAQLADVDRKDRTAAVLAMTLRAARELDVAPHRKRKRRVVLRAANTLKASRLTEGGHQVRGGLPGLGKRR
jgi:hypothetical protein